MIPTEHGRKYQCSKTGLFFANQDNPKDSEIVMLKLQSDGPPADGFIGPLALQFHGEGVFIGPVNHRNVLHRITLDIINRSLGLQQWITHRMSSRDASVASAMVASTDCSAWLALTPNSSSRIINMGLDLTSPIGSLLPSSGGR